MGFCTVYFIHAPQTHHLPQPDLMLSCAHQESILCIIRSSRNALPLSEVLRCAHRECEQSTTFLFAAPGVRLVVPISMFAPAGMAARHCATLRGRLRPVLCPAFFLSLPFACFWRSEASIFVQFSSIVIEPAVKSGVDSTCRK